VEALPELNSLSDAELNAMIERLEREENEISYQRRLLQGRIDILRAERTVRKQKAQGEGEGTLHVDVDRLTEVLLAKAPPPADAEGE
jgi:hypothetical protein